MEVLQVTVTTKSGKATLSAPLQTAAKLFRLAAKVKRQAKDAKVDVGTVDVLEQLRTIGVELTERKKSVELKKTK